MLESCDNPAEEAKGRCFLFLPIPRGLLSGRRRTPHRPFHSSKAKLCPSVV